MGILSTEKPSIAQEPPDTDRRPPTSPRARATAAVYGVLLVAVAGGLAAAARPSIGHERLGLVGVLVAMSACDYLITRKLRPRVAVYDMGIALALIGVVLAGPLAGFAIALAPDLIHLARQRRAFWNAGLAANVASWGAAALAGAGMLSIVSPAGHATAVLAAGLAMLAVNYLIARLLLASLRDHRSIGALLRDEFVAMLGLELASIAIAAIAALLLPSVGVLALLGFAALVYAPQLTLERLARAPSVAGLTIADAAATYRAAIADELDLSRHDRRCIEQTAALVERRPERVGAPANPLGLMQDALVATICLQTSPKQTAFRASPRAQVVVLAQEWAQLTARCTPALSHREAMDELGRGPAARDAPAALVAARAIVQREHALTRHIAGVPRLHRVPVPRPVRRRYLPSVLARLTA